MPPDFGVFTPSEARTLDAVVKRMVGTREDGTKEEHIDSALEVIASYVTALPPSLQGQLRRAIRLFEWAPLVFIGRPTTFSRLSPSSQDAYIRTWSGSGFSLRRRVFRSLRDLALMGYYSQPDHRKSIGYLRSDGL